MKFVHVTVFIIFFSILATGFAGTIPFEQSSAKGYFERSLQSAMAEKTKEAFIHKAMQAADTAYSIWEKEALTAYDGAIVTGEDDISGFLKTEARTAIQKMLEEALGSYDARCFEIVVPEYAKEELYARINQMMQEDPHEDMVATYSAWDENVGHYVQQLLAGIDSQLQTTRDALLSEINTTTQEYRKGFIETLDEKLNNIHKLIQRDIELYYVGAKNTYFYQHYSDTASLRFYTQQQSASQITAQILESTTDKTDAILTEVQNKLSYTISSIGLPPEGDDLDMLVQAGIYAWKAAEDDLLAARLSWERSSLDGYRQADEIWAKSFEQLVQKRNEWLASIQQQIRQGIINWNDTFIETDHQYASALKLLDETIAAQKEQFDDYCASTRELITSGSQSLAIALENISWLGSYFTTLTGLQYSNDPQTRSTILQKLSADTTETKELKIAVFQQLNQWYDLKVRYNDIIARMTLQYHTQDMWGTPVTVFKSGEFVKRFTGEEQAFAGAMANFRALYMAVREGNIANIQSSNAFNFETGLHKYIVGMQCLPLLGSGQIVTFEELIASLKNLPQYAGQPEKLEALRPFLSSLYYSYSTGEITATGQYNGPAGTDAWSIARMEAFRQFAATATGNFEDLFGYTEVVQKTTGLLTDDRYDNEGNPLFEYYLYKDTDGAVIIDGLYQQAHDPYLMTAAEFDLEKEKLTLAYWEERLRRAQKLYEYAYNETGRPDAQTQKANYQAAIDTYNKAKKEYEDALALLSGQLKDALVAAQKRVDDAQKKFEIARTAYEAAQKLYQEAMERCLYYSNPDAKEMAIQLVNEATQQIIAITNRIQQKEQKWITARMNYYKALMLQEHNSEASQYAQRIELTAKILEGYTTDEGQVRGLRDMYTTWQTIQNGTLDDVMAAIDDNNDILFLKLETILPGYAEDERLTFLQEALENREKYSEEYEEAKDLYIRWKAIVSIENTESRVHEAIVSKLNELQANNFALTWSMLQEQIDTIANVSATVDERKAAIGVLVAYTADTVDSLELTELLDETDPETIHEKALQIFLGALLKHVYTLDITTHVDNQVVYPDTEILYAEYDKQIQDEYRIRRIDLVNAINALGKSFEDLYHITRNVVVYLLHDFDTENLETSLYTKNNIIQQANAAVDEASVTYFEQNKKTVEKLLHILNATKEAATDSDGIHWEYFNSTYQDLVSMCDMALSNRNVREALEYGYLYTLVTTLKDSIDIHDEASFNAVTTMLEKSIEDIGIVIDVYKNELAGCDDTTIDEKIKTYISMLETGKDQQGNPLSDTELHIVQVKLTAVTQPDIFDFIHPLAYEGEQSVVVMQSFARYVEQFYELSLEKRRRTQDEGFTGKIAEILGIDAGQAQTMFKQSMPVGQLIEYGRKAESYIQTKEYGTLPQSLKEALQAVVSAYHDVLIQKAKYENRNTDSNQASAAYEKSRSVYEKLSSLQKKYEELIALHNAMYGNQENEYTASQQNYYQLQPWGTWPGFADAIIRTLQECNVLYSQVINEINNTQYNDLQAQVFAKLAKLEETRRNYEIVDYVARYLKEGEMYSSVEDYANRMRSSGKDEQFIQDVIAHITHELTKRQDIQALKENPTGIKEVQNNWDESDTGWILAAYYQGIQENSEDATTFNALLYDTDFRAYALLMHFQKFIQHYIHEKGFSDFDDVFGLLDGEILRAGEFLKLPQYSTDGQIQEDIKQLCTSLYEDFKQVYNTTVSQYITVQSLTIHNAYTYTASNTSPADIYAHFMAYLTSGTFDQMPAFEDVFGTIHEAGFEPSGFTALTQCGTQEWQQFFVNNYPTFQMLYSKLQQDSSIIAYSVLPEGVREYAIFTDYFAMAHSGITSADDAEKLLAYYGIHPDISGYDELKMHTESFIQVMDVALAYDGSMPIEEYIQQNNITDPKEKNFLILYSIAPELADPVNLIVTDGQVPLVLTGYQMQTKARELFEAISNEDDNGLQSLLAMCMYAAHTNSVIAQNVYQFILSQRNTYSNWRDYIGIMEQYYEQYSADSNSPSMLYQVIIDKEKLKKRDEDGLDIAQKWYKDINNNGSFDSGDKTLQDFIAEYDANGYGISRKENTSGSMEAVKSDGLEGNVKGYYTGDNKSYYNAMIDKATTMAAALDMLVQVAQMATQATDTFTFYDEDGSGIDTSFVRDIRGLLNELQDAGYDGTVSMGDDESTGSPIEQALQIIKSYSQGTDDARIKQLVDSMREEDNTIQQTLLKAYADIEKMGIVLESDNLQEYLESDTFQEAQSVYTANKTLFEQAQIQVDNALQAYHDAQDDYTKQLEIISILYNRLEEARKLKEDEEMLYAYASTPYLYNSQTNAEGGDPDDAASKLKADAKEQYELALKYRNEVQQRIEELKHNVEAVQQQKVEHDQEYVKLRNELIERAQRAYKTEKLAMCMQNEIKQLSVAYQELKGQYEAKKDAFIAATDDEYKDERDKLIDRMLQYSFVNGITTVKRKDIDENTATLVAKALVLSRGYSVYMPVGVSEAIMAKMVYDYIKDNKDRTATIGSLEYHLQQSAYYFDKNAQKFGASRKIDTDPWFGSIPGGTVIADTNSPMHEYLQLLKDNKITNNALIGEYYSNFLTARDAEFSYENLSIVYGGYYEVYKPIKKRFDYLWNKTIKVLGKKIHPLRPLAYVLKPTVLLFELGLNKLFKPIREAEQKWKNNDHNAKAQLAKIHSKLTELQEIKLKMLQAKAALARYTEIESLDDMQQAGAFVYYNPKTMQTVSVQKPTLKAALKEIAGKYGIMISDSDLQFMVEENRQGDWVNVNNYRTTIHKTDENGYETDETVQVLHAGTVGQTYANIMNQQKRDVFDRYMAHVQAMYTQGGYDRVVIDRAVEKDLYGIWAGDSSDYQSALTIGAESKGTIRAMLAYMGYVEGMPVDVINQLDAMISTENEQQVEELFAQYVKQYEGINDRELAQRKALQVHEWQLKKQQLADKKADWDRMVSRIFQRGVKQWEMMVQSFMNRWKNWKDETEEQILEGNKQWDERMKQLQQAKLQWLADAQSGVSAKQLHKQLTGIEVLLYDMVTMMKEKYGNVISKVDVHAMLLDILKEQPELLSSEIMNLSKQHTEFGLTQIRLRSYNYTIFDDANRLSKEFETAQKKTDNIALLKALTELLKRCKEQIDIANENSQTAALQFVSAYNFGIDGNTYTRKLSVSDKKQKIDAYRPYQYTDSLVLGTYNIPMLMDLYQKDGVAFTATMNVVLSQVQTRMGMMMRPDIPWGFTYYVGEFGVIEPGPKLKNKGKGEYARITKEVYNAEKEKATEDAICQYVDAGIAVTLSIATANPMVGAAYMSWNQFSQVATGDLSLQHWAVQTGISVGASYAGGYIGGATNSAVYGSLTTSAIQGLGNFVEYKQDGGLGLQWGSKQQWRSFGIGASTALVGAKIGQMYGDSWNNSWQHYGYTASSSYLVNRFDGTGSWKDDLIQASVSTAALWASNELLAQGTVLGNMARSTNAIAPINRFIQGTLENIILAGVQVGQGKSIYDALLEQNWAKTQYTMADYLSDWASKIAQEHSEATRKMMEMEKKEGLLGLAWLGLSRAGSLLGSAWDGVSEIFEKGTNWLQGEGFVTNKEIAVKAALQEFHRMGIEEAKAAALQEYGIQKGKKILDSFYTDSREKTDA